MHPSQEVPIVGPWPIEVGAGEYGLLFRDHQVTVHRLAAFLSGDQHVADEITAEVFAKVFPRWRQGAVSDPLPYLRRAVVNELRSRWRRRAHEHRALARHSRDAMGRDDVDRLALREPLVAALLQLPLQQRSVVVLRFLDDLSEAEVARSLGMAEGTVKSQTHRGLAKLRNLMEGAS
jgi:RNA polymerase sigma-70 factor (sigma-E family)